jgi:hypothetical protein
LGEINGHSKLTKENVLYIRQVYKNKLKIIKELAVEFRVSTSHISNILKNKRWKHI